MTPFTLPFPYPSVPLSPQFHLRARLALSIYWPLYIYLLLSCYLSLCLTHAKYSTYYNYLLHWPKSQLLLYCCTLLYSTSP